jgi:hypothetical protein
MEAHTKDEALNDLLSEVALLERLFAKDDGAEFDFDFMRNCDWEEVLEHSVQNIYWAYRHYRKALRQLNDAEKYPRPPPLRRTVSLPKITYGVDVLHQNPDLTQLRIDRFQRAPGEKRYEFWILRQRDEESDNDKWIFRQLCFVPPPNISLVYVEDFDLTTQYPWLISEVDKIKHDGS